MAIYIAKVWIRMVGGGYTQKTLISSSESELIKHIKSKSSIRSHTIKKSTKTIIEV